MEDEVPAAESFIRFLNSVIMSSSSSLATAALLLSFEGLGKEFNFFGCVTSMGSDAKDKRSSKSETASRLVAIG